MALPRPVRTPPLHAENVLVDRNCIRVAQDLEDGFVQFGGVRTNHQRRLRHTPQRELRDHIENSNLEHVWIIKVTGPCKAGGDEGAGARDGLHWWR